MTCDLGSMYPWESALTGYEVCPQEVYGRNEIHITGDIAFASHQYYIATGDKDWLKEYGFQLIYNAAEFWASRATYDEHVHNGYVINDVMPPDEYQYPVNNSYYTNVLARLNLQLAIRYGELLQINIPELWKTISENMFIPYDKTLDYHPEFEGFKIKKSGTVVKQADVILGNYPLGIEMDYSTLKNDLHLYDNVTDSNGPAMTQSMFTIGFLQVNDFQRAEMSFKRNFDNIGGPFRMWSEIRQGRGAKNFITAAGGFFTISYIWIWWNQIKGRWFIV